MADSDEVDEAVFALLADATLAALMPGGVFYDVAKGPATKFVIVSLLGHEEDYVFADAAGEDTAFESFTYLVKAVEKSTSNMGDVKLAGRRIQRLLRPRPFVPLTITGYSHVKTTRVEVVNLTEVDDLDKNIRWQHRGGHYEIVVTPT